MSTDYPIAAQDALDELYRVHAASFSMNELTSKIKIYVLDRELGGSSNFYAAGGSITDEIKVKCLEIQFLELKGLLKLELA